MEAIKVNANHGVQEAFRDIFLRIAENQELASIYHRELPTSGTVEGLDEYRFAFSVFPITEAPNGGRA